MKYTAKIIAENPDIEEELTIEINGIKLQCFVEEYNCAITIGHKYTVKLDPIVFDDVELEKSPVEVKRFKQKEGSFAYYITGIFDPTQKTIDAGIIISLKNEDISVFWYLENQFVVMDVDRINLVVLEDISTKG